MHKCVTSLQYFDVNYSLLLITTRLSSGMIFFISNSSLPSSRTTCSMCRMSLLYSMTSLLEPVRWLHSQSFHCSCEPRLVYIGDWILSTSHVGLTSVDRLLLQNAANWNVNVYNVNMSHYWIFMEEFWSIIHFYQICFIRMWVLSHLEMCNSNDLNRKNSSNIGNDESIKILLYEVFVYLWAHM